jgi:hypothetical protein
MLRALTAPPGGGKSKQAMRYIVRELLTSDRPIKTNLKVEFLPWALNGKLQMGLIEWLRRRGHKKAADECLSRIELLTDNQVKQFWNYRGELGSVDEETGERIVKAHSERIETVKKDTDGNYRAGITHDGGVFYVIDEAHDHFNSHEWQNVGKECLWYASKNRHFGDDIWVVSQAMSNVVKQFRVLIQETILVRNLGFERLGYLRMPRKTVLKAYLYCPLEFSGKEPLYVEWVDNAKDEIEQCYNTAAAVAGSSADVGKANVWGIHWSWGAAAVVAILVGIYYASEYGPKFLLSMNTPKKAAAMEPARSSGTAVVGSSVRSERVSQGESPVTNDVPAVYMRGFGRVRDGFVIWLTDGREFRTGDPEVIALEKNRVNINGTWHSLAPNSAPAPVTAGVPNYSNRPLRVSGGSVL